MPRIYSAKYPDFEESAPMERRGKQPPYGLTKYIDVTCPHCNNVCAEIPEHLMKQKKASMCLQHLRVCPDFKGSVAPAPTRDNTSEIEMLRAKVNQNEQAIKNIAKQLGLGDPLPTTNEELSVILVESKKREREEEFADLRNMTDAEKKKVRTFTHPDKGANRSAAYNRFTARMLDDFNEANARQ